MSECFLWISIANKIELLFHYSIQNGFLEFNIYDEVEAEVNYNFKAFILFYETTAAKYYVQFTISGKRTITF